MAFRSHLNSVLRRLREDTITSDWTGAVLDNANVDDYHQLISELFNEAKQVCEDAWNWTDLRTIESVATSNGTASYTMSNLDSRARVLQVIDDSNDAQLTQLSDSAFYNYTYIGTTQVGAPTFFRLKGNEISLWPTPDAAYNIRVHAVQPQADLSLAADTLTIPSNVVILGAYALALNERGEDGGTLSDAAAARFSQALTDAISQDELRTVNESTWYAS